jgi:hypothetical protein
VRRNGSNAGRPSSAGGPSAGGWNCGSRAVTEESPPSASLCQNCLSARNRPTSRSTLPPLERAEFDCGEAAVKRNGQLVKGPFLAGRLRFSGAMLVEGFPKERQEAFLLGQRQAFECWGGVPRMAVYDTLKAAVLQVLEGHNRGEHETFRPFQSV